MVEERDGVACVRPASACASCDGGRGCVRARVGGRHTHQRLASLPPSSLHMPGAGARLLAALAWAADQKLGTLHIRADSDLLVKQMRGQYRVKNAGLQPLYERAKGLVRQIGTVTFVHVRRELNKEADRLANEAMDEAART